MISWYRFLKTTINKLCSSETVEQLNKVYNDARYGWMTANGEVRGGFDRLGLSAADISLINDVYYKLKELLKGGVTKI